MVNVPLKLGPDGLPYPQYYNQTLGDYESVEGENGSSFVEIKNPDPIDIKISNTDIIVPTEIKGVTKEYIFGSVSALGANASFISNPIDCGLVKRICGHVSADQNGTLYIQQSDDGSTYWLTISTIAIAPSTQVTIDSVSYDSGTTYNVELTSRYARVILLNGATAQTKLVLSGYTSSM